MTIILHRDQFRLKDALTVSVGIETLLAIEMTAIFLTNLVQTEMVHLPQKLRKQVVKHFFPIPLMTADLQHGNRIWSLADKHLLIHIQPNAYHTVANQCSAQTVLYQDAANLEVAHIDIVGPFDVYLFLQHPRQIAAHGLCYGHGDDILVMRRDILRMNENTEGEILAHFTFPVIRALATPLTLEFCPRDSHLLIVSRCVTAEEIIRAVSFFKMYDFTIHICPTKVEKKE